MKPSIVVDVGNTRIKWGLCLDPTPHSVLSPQYSSLPPDDPAAWQRQLEQWQQTGPQSWAISGVQPQRRDRLVDWARQRGDAVRVLDDWQCLPLTVRLEHPEWVGIDRLLNAVAVKARLGETPQLQGKPAVIVDAGSAVTVDWLDETGAFAGGAIFPGLRLMARALRDYTALLPLIEVKQSTPRLPGKSTPEAQEAGVFWAAAGGIRALTDQLAARADATPALFVTGGDAALLRPALEAGFVLWPDMTLQGIRLTAEAQP
jgi:type III pantothenate kinase